MKPVRAGSLLCLQINRAGKKGISSEIHCNEKRHENKIENMREHTMEKRNNAIKIKE